MHTDCRYNDDDNDNNEYENDDYFSKIMNTLSVGAKLASTFFLNYQKNDVITSVLEKLNRGHGIHKNYENEPDNIVKLLLKLIGLDSSKAEVYAFDGVILLAQMISSSLTGNNPLKRQQRTSSPSKNEFSPFRYLIKHPKVVDMISQMKDPNLIDKILEEVNEKLKNYEPEDVECIPLLICKLSPFVRGMQRSLKFFLKREQDGEESKACWRNATRNDDFCVEDDYYDDWKKSNTDERIFFFVPSLNEVIRHGDECDEKFPKCFY